MSTPSFVVGLIVGIGGTYGFIKSGSVMSMIMGLISAVILMYAGARIPSRFGYQLSIGNFLSFSWFWI